MDMSFTAEYLAFRDEARLGQGQPCGGTHHAMERGAEIDQRVARDVYLSNRKVTIYGGTSEAQNDILAKAVPGH